MTRSISRGAPLAVLLTIAAGAWLAAVHAAAEPTGPGFATAWLSIVLLGAGPAIVLGAATARAGLAAATALSAAGAAAIGAAATTLVEGRGLAPLDLPVDVLVALAVTMPAATAAFAATSRRPARSPRPAAHVAIPAAAPRAAVLGPTTRRSFLQLGAGSVTTAALGGMAARGVLPASAGADTLTFEFTVTDGFRDLVDRTQGYFRGFKLTGAQGGPAFPGPCIGNLGPAASPSEIFEGDTVRLILTNDTPRDHHFLLQRARTEAPDSPVVGPALLPAGRATELTFTAPQAGTYIYRDAHINNRLLGMHGVMVVQPQGARANVPYAAASGRLALPIEVEKQYTWILQNYDQVLGEVAVSDFAESEIVDYPLDQIVPRFFYINGETGDEAAHNERTTVPVIPQQNEAASMNGVLLRLVNTSAATHSPHWHGNHVFIVQRNAVPERAGYVEERDVVGMEPLACLDLLLPAHTGYDAFPPVDADHPALHNEEYLGIQRFPMHCHAEMSQTAAGGMYPLGMLTDWHLGADAFAAANSARQLAGGRAAGRVGVRSGSVRWPTSRRLGNRNAKPRQRSAARKG